MVKNFSVEWLAQSVHDCTPKDLLEPKKEPCRPHVPCLVQPRPPTSYDKVYLQPKPKISKVEQKLEATSVPKEKEVTISATPRNCSSPSFSENSGYSSGYESEAAASECASVEDGPEMEQEGVLRRIRTKFTPEQIDKLEKIFHKHKYLDVGERVKIALKLNLSETQVRTWFQNRRMKLKREMQEMRADYLVPALHPVLLPPIHPVQYHCFDRQRLPFPPQGLNGPLMHQMPPQQMPSAQHMMPHQQMPSAQHMMPHQQMPSAQHMMPHQQMPSAQHMMPHQQMPSAQHMMPHQQMPSAQHMMPHQQMPSAQHMMPHQQMPSAQHMMPHQVPQHHIMMPTQHYY
ncbi:homeobox protein vent1-like [Myxocyprinus asiaticus]|uniref:homeobox protein vent1-like n=1 Tax=Myxocyprinus asiaticus TaxID=70543 RepID=UPI002222712B|nr:homeobox protein vent1-like [Myxocyprinus asiaticus]